MRHPVNDERIFFYFSRIMDSTSCHSFFYTFLLAITMMTGLAAKDGNYTIIIIMFNYDYNFNEYNTSHMMYRMYRIRHSFFIRTT